MFHVNARLWSISLLALVVSACSTKSHQPEKTEASKARAPTISIIVNNKGIVEEEILQQCATTELLYQKFSKMIIGTKIRDADISIQIKKLRKLGFGTMGTKFGGNELVISVTQRRETPSTQIFTCRADQGVLGLMTSACSRVNYCVGKVVDQSEKWFASQKGKR